MPNTIAQNLARLQAAKTAIATAIATKGGTVSSGDGLEEFPTDIATISGGGPAEVNYSLEDGFTAQTKNSFSTGRYFNWNNPYEIQVCVIKLADSLNNSGVAMGPFSGYWGTPKMGITDEYIFFCTNGSASQDTDQIVKTYDASPLAKNEPFWVKATYDGGGVGVGVIRLMISYDGTNFTEIVSKTITVAMRDTTTVLAFGAGNDSSSYTVFPYLAFIWNECYIKINGEYVWGRDPNTDPIVPQYADGMICNLTRNVDRAYFLNPISMSNSVTAEVCFNIGPNETNAARFITLYNAINTSIAFWEYTSGVKSIDFMVNDSWVLSEQNTFVIPEGTPTTISAVLTPSGWTLYLNGVEMLSGSNGSSGTFAECYVGRNPTNSNRTLQDTTVYSARLYNKALTSAEIASNRLVDISLFGGD